MKFATILAPEAVEDFRSFKAASRAEIRDAIERHLSSEPGKVSRSRIKRLPGLGRPQFRLRVGEVRIFYEVEGQTVEISPIIPKSEADRWLAQFGKLE